MKNQEHSAADVLVLGIGNVLMGDEGAGVHVARRLGLAALPENVRCLDGGTGSLLLLEPMQQAGRIILIDATIDGNPPGTLRRLTPRFSSEYPATLTAHDIGLKDLLDAAYLLGGPLNVTLYTISIDALQGVGLELSPVIAQRVDDIARVILEEMAGVAEPTAENRQKACHA